jgi:hypothetical protein
MACKLCNQRLKSRIFHSLHLFLSVEQAKFVLNTDSFRASFPCLIRSHGSIPRRALLVSKAQAAAAATIGTLSAVASSTCFSAARP